MVMRVRSLESSKGSLVLFELLVGTFLLLIGLSSFVYIIGKMQLRDISFIDFILTSILLLANLLPDFYGFRIVVCRHQEYIVN